MCPGCQAVLPEAKKFCFNCGFKFESSEIPTRRKNVQEDFILKKAEPPKEVTKPIAVSFKGPQRERKVAEVNNIDVEPLNSSIPNLSTFIPNSFANANWKDGTKAAIVTVAPPILSAVVLLIYFNIQGDIGISIGSILGMIGSITALTFGGTFSANESSEGIAGSVSVIPSSVTALSLLLLSRTYRKHLKDSSFLSNIDFFKDLLIFLIPSTSAVFFITLIFRGTLLTETDWPIQIGGSAGGALVGFVIMAFLFVTITGVLTQSMAQPPPFLLFVREYLMVPIWALGRGFIGAMGLTLTALVPLTLVSESGESFLFLLIAILIFLPSLTLFGLGIGTFSPIQFSGDLDYELGVSESLGLASLTIYNPGFWILPILVIASLLFTSVIMILRRGDAQFARRDGIMIIGLFACLLIFVFVFIHAEISGNISVQEFSLIPTAQVSLNGLAFLTVPLAAGLAWIGAGLLLNRISTTTLNRWNSKVNSWQ